MQRSTIREMLAEFLGTLILVTFGCHRSLRYC